jgi:hypothetical protein
MKTGLTLTAGIFLASLSAFAQPASTEQNWTPTVEFEKVEHNFGSIPEGPKATYDFNFTNTGKEAIKVVTAQAGCGCTTPEWPRYDIEPGKTAKISVGYNSAGRPGPFTKDVNVTFSTGQNNDKQGAMKLTILGNVASGNPTGDSKGSVAPATLTPAEKASPSKASKNVVNSPIPQ